MTAHAVLLWRHGRTAYNAEGRMQGQIDIPLDDVGTWQAAQSAEHLAHRHHPARIVSSDLGRALTTARTLGELIGVDVTTDQRLRERHFGQWEGLTADQIRERWPAEYEVWRARGDLERIGAESRAAVAERLALAIAEHTDATPDDQTLVVVSHGASITLGLTRLLGLDAEWRGLAGLHNAHWSVLRPSGRRPGTWFCEAHNVGPAVGVEDWNAGMPADALPSATADALRP